MREKKISQLDIASGAYIAGKEADRIFSPQKTFPYKAVAYWVLAAFIIAAAGYFSFKFFFQPASQEAIRGEEKPISNFLPVEDQKTVVFSEANPGDLVGALINERGRNLRFDTVIYFPIKTYKSGGEEKFLYDSREFVNFLNWRAPKEFSNSLEGDFNALMVYGQDLRDFAVILKIKNFERALASLFDWERTVWMDWKPFLFEEDVKTISQFSFADDIIKNNDARVLKNGVGKIILGYVIFDYKYVVISTSREALSTILERLIALPPR